MAEWQTEPEGNKEDYNTLSSQHCMTVTWVKQQKL